MVSERQRRRQLQKVQPGDGHPLPRYRWWQPFWRSLLHLRLTEDGQTHVWSVDVRVWGDSNGEVLAQLYRDGEHVARSKLPASFAVPGGTVQVAVSGYGLRRCHFVGDDGRERQFLPDRRSAEGRRARLQRDHPGVSRLIGAASVLVLVVGLVLGVPQIVQEVTQFPPVAERLGATFTSPVLLPASLNVGILVATLVASTERALRLRYHWLLDSGLFDGEG